MRWEVGVCRLFSLLEQMIPAVTFVLAEGFEATVLGV
jgi:hypothetical protein